MAPLATFPLVTRERSFVPLYVVDVDGDAGHDLAMLVHPNGLIVLCLAPSHWAVAVQHEGGVTVALNDSLLAAEVSGKRKRGAVTLHTDTVLATISVPGARTSHVRACVRAKLLEANARLGTPHAAQLLREAHADAGFIAVLMPFDAGCIQDLCERALTEEQYEARQRTQNR